MDVNSKMAEKEQKTMKNSVKSTFSKPTDTDTLCEMKNTSDQKLLF